MQVVEVLNPLAREFKSIGTLRKELAELQQELAKAHNQVCYSTGTGNHSIQTTDYCIPVRRLPIPSHHMEPNLMLQVHLSETRVSSALDKLAHMETLVNDRLLPPDGASSTSTAQPTSLVPSTSSTARVRAKKPPRRGLNVSGPVKPYNPSLKNFWYPVAFSSDLKDDTMVN
jgi:chlorophyllide a oxygenase